MPMSIGGKFRHGGDRVIHLRHERPSLWHAGLAKDIEDLWEPWMREADRLLEDAALVESVYEAQGKRHPQSRSRGRRSPSARSIFPLRVAHGRARGTPVLSRPLPSAPAAKDLNHSASSRPLSDWEPNHLTGECKMTNQRNHQQGHRAANRCAQRGPYRTADLYRVNFEVQQLKTLDSVAFPKSYNRQNRSKSGGLC